MMNSQDIESRYASLKQARDTGSITEEQFRNSVSQLRLKASDGSWYAIDPADGRWMKWDGRTWEKTAAPAAPQKGAPQPGFQRQAAPSPAVPSKAGGKTAAAQPVAQQPPKKFFPLLGISSRAPYVYLKNNFLS